MSWPGLRPLSTGSILARDIYVVIGGVRYVIHHFSRGWKFTCRHPSICSTRESAREVLRMISAAAK